MRDCGQDIWETSSQLAKQIKLDTSTSLIFVVLEGGLEAVSLSYNPSSFPFSILKWIPELPRCLGCVCELPASASPSAGISGVHP